MKTKRLGFLILVWALLVGKWLFEMYFGPDGRPVSVLAFAFLVFVTSLRGSLSVTGSEPVLPPGLDVVLPGSASYTIIHVAGSAILFGFAVFAFLFVEYRNERRRNLVYSVTAIMIGMYGFLFVTSFAGLSNFFPLRWLPFLYVPLAVLSAYGLLTVVILVFSRESQVMTTVGVLLVCIIILMSGTHLGAIDNPLFSSANGAQRYAITAQEDAGIQFAADYRDDLDTYSDKTPSAILNRYYGAQGEVLTYNVSAEEFTTRNQAAVLYRPYHRTNHVWYRLQLDRSGTGVIGELPYYVTNCRGAEVIYTTGRNTSRGTKILLPATNC